MRIRYGGKAAILSVVVGVVAAAYTPVMASIALGHAVFVFGPITLFGALFVVGGLLMLRGSTYVRVEADELVVCALVGPLQRRFPFASWSEVELVGGKLWTVTGGVRRRVPIHRAQCHPADWVAFEGYLRERGVA